MKDTANSNTDNAQNIEKGTTAIIEINKLSLLKNFNKNVLKIFKRL
jgi:hypothetical protein